ncbi:hypothetical protein SSX86_032646 [Deinandra increscens subsp. villosa]|uniref:Uncharacterized protein n=1 Tax=Deinandra increscens subsp. villosa TaxID=3103831 RepID=A0AAP0GGP1_9ASTR
MNTSSSSSEIHRHITDPGERYIDETIDEISSGFDRKLDLECNDVSNSDSLPDAEVRGDNEEENDEDDDNEDDEDNDDDFTFMFVGDVDSANSDDKPSEDGEIRQVFPLFDQNLLLGGDYDVEEIDRLPIRPPVDKIFIQSPRGFPPSTASERDDATAGAYCDWSTRTATGTGTAEMSKKSNSTGFSKLWRLKDIVGRSNSSGRDAFVFLKSSDRAAAATAASSSSKPVAGDGMYKVAGGNAKVVKKGTKGKKSTVSAHEAYLKNRGGRTEEERRRSYLPYRPELMGFFTNVNGGLTRNVHPY